MRLICPNCEAEYEVDDAAIPDMGRDVQCSNCGHAWFQLPPEIELALEQEDELFGGEGAVADPVFPDEQDADLPAPAPAAEAPRRSVDENLLAILREEAEREAAARKAEAAPIETQPDLGLPPASAAPAATAATAAAAGAGMGAVARRIAQLKGIDPDAPPAAQGVAPRSRGAPGGPRVWQAAALAAVVALLIGFVSGRFAARANRGASFAIVGALPKRAELYLDTKKLTVADGVPMPIPAGSHTITIALPKNQKREIPFTARPGEHVVIVSPLGKSTAPDDDPAP